MFKPSQEIGSLPPFWANIAPRCLILCVPLMEVSIAGTRSLCAKENPGGQGDKPETSTTTSEGHESVEETES